MSAIQQRDVFIYISNYIKKKYPIYFDELGNVKNENPAYLISWVNELFHKLRDSYSFDDIVNGVADAELKKLVDEYVKNNMSDVKDKFNSIKNHIIKVINQKSRFNDSPILVNKIAMQIALDITDKISSVKNLNGSYDDVIFDKYLGLRSNFKNKLLGNVKKIILSSGEKTGLSDDSLDKIFDCMTSVLLSEYGKKNRMSDEWIKACFKKIVQSIKKQTKDRITLVVDEIYDNADVMIRVSKRQVIEDILILAIVHGKISAVKIINGEMNNFIRSFVNGKNLATERQKREEFNMGLSLEHIIKVLEEEVEEYVSYVELEKITLEVYQHLKNENYTDDDIIRSRCDSYIRDLYFKKYYVSPIDLNRNKMRENSVVQKKKKGNKVHSIFHRKLAIKRKLQQDIATILIVAVLGSAGAHAVKGYIHYRQDVKAAGIVQELDDTNYSRSVKNGDERAVNGVVRCFNKYNEYGAEYGYLCFYEAYQELSIGQLDDLIDDVQKFCAINEDNDGLINLVQDVDCFYDYMYECLLKMGCEEIKNARYLDAILSYKQSYYGNRYGIASDFFVHADDQRALDDMIKLYEKYNYKYQVELGKQITNQNVESSVDNAKIKRGV